MLRRCNTWTSLVARTRKPIEDEEGLSATKQQQSVSPSPEHRIYCLTEVARLSWSDRPVAVSQISPLQILPLIHWKFKKYVEAKLIENEKRVNELSMKGFEQFYSPRIIARHCQRRKVHLALNVGRHFGVCAVATRRQAQQWREESAPSASVGRNVLAARLRQWCGRVWHSSRSWFHFALNWNNTKLKFLVK